MSLFNPPLRRSARLQCPIPRVLPRTALRSLSTPAHPPLPTEDTLRSKYPFTGSRIRERSTVTNLNTARKIVRAMGIDKLGGKGNGPVTVVEAWPGFGTLTRAVLELPNVDKVIAFESDKSLAPWIEQLAASDPKLSHVQKDPYDWDSYTSELDSGALSAIPSAPWEQSHDSLFYLAQVPVGVLGEQITAQFINCMCDHSWLFTRGRANLGLVMSEVAYNRLAAPAGNRGKIAVMVEALATAREAVPGEWLSPVGEHLWPREGPRTKAGQARLKDWVGVVLEPHVSGSISPDLLEMWEFVLRGLFVTRKHSLKKSLKHLAPNADILAGPIAARGVDLNLTVDKLSVQDFEIIVDEFNKWPFKPDVLFRDTPRENRHGNKNK